MNPEKKKLVLIGIVAVLVIIVGYWFIANKSSYKKSSENLTPTESAIPTIDNSVKVDFTSNSGGKEVVLSIKNIPARTTTIDYELSYQTQQQGLQGVIGTINVLGKDSYEKQITLGTCSSGKCVYHQVVGKIKLTLKFNGDYGEKLFEKEYEI